MADEKRNDANGLSRRRFLAGATAAAGLVTTASGLTLLGGTSAAAAAETAPASSVSVSVPFGGFATYSFQNNVTGKKIGVTMTYSPTDPKDAGQANAKAVVLDIFAPGVSTAAGKPSGTASGPAGKQYFQVEKPANGQYQLIVHNWDGMKRTVSVTLMASYVGGAAIALSGMAGAAPAAVTVQPTSSPITWPFPYTKLDPEVVRKEGHKGYYAGGCMYGAFYGIMRQLQKEVGAPFTNIPLDMMRYGEGGGVGWGTLCGALNGSAAAMNLVLGKDDYSKIISDLFGWYTTTAFPSDVSNQYAEDGKFLVETMKYDKALPQSVVASPLCHASVTEWCKVAGVNVADPKRAERCGRLTGDVAAQAVMLLNQQADKTFMATFKPSEAVTGCTSCHNSKGGATTGGIVNTKMDCAPCHGEDPHNQ